MCLGNTYCVQGTMQDFIEDAKKHSHCPRSQKFVFILKDETYTSEELYDNMAIITSDTTVHCGIICLISVINKCKIVTRKIPLIGMFFPLTYSSFQTQLRCHHLWEWVLCHSLTQQSCPRCASFFTVLYFRLLSVSLYY